MEKYQVVFIDWDDEEVPYTKQYFNSAGEAENWVEENERTFDDMDGEGGWITRYFYYNSQTGIDYPNFKIQKISSELNEEFYRMQKLAGLITEEEYKARLWYKQYSENISKALDDLKQTLKDEGYDNK